MPVDIGMGRILAALAIMLTGAHALGQQGGNQGTIGQGTDGTAQAIERGISVYLNGPETKSVLTPGESVDYTLSLKSGQVVVGEARSDAFDPAIEIVGPDKKVLASNDDRYPGDQRPLILWRCPQDGAYTARIRCFHDRSGGQVSVRFKTYDAVDLPTDATVDAEIDAGTPFLIRIPMKAGGVKQLVTDSESGRPSFVYNAVIAPNGLPDVGLSLRLQPAVYAIVAPVAGDYYVMHTPSGQPGEKGKIRVRTRELAPAKLVLEGGAASTTAPNDVPALAELTVKKGETLEVATPELHLDSRLVLAEAPDVSKYGLDKPETNPFFPHPDRRSEESRAFDLLPARARDGRVIDFRARRDTTLWVATNGAGPDGKRFTIGVKPAATPFPEAAPNVGKLRVADYDHWAFDAKPGDVMTFSSTAPAFNQVVVVRDPDLEEIRHVEAPLDQATEGWQMVVQKPGRYLVTISCLGDGGAGEYSLSRRGFAAKVFDRSNPAKGEIAPGEIQVWKFTAVPNEPLLVHWFSTNWNYDVSIYDEKGQDADFQREETDPHNRFGILKVDERRTYVIVLTGKGAKSNYSIELGAIPGSKKP